MQVVQWAMRYGVGANALNELTALLFTVEPEPEALRGAPGTEARVVSELRLEASQLGMRLWRNNSGAFYDDKGNFVRFGLGNDSKQFNTVCKSSDLIGISNKLITPADVGKPRGQLVAREAKKPGWKYTGTPREVGQLNFINIVNRFGGDAAFATGPGSFVP
jgi:hypothetical protein